MNAKHLGKIVSVASLVIGLTTAAWADMTMKVMVVNPSETEVKEFDIRSPLPPEVHPEHVLDADGLKVEYDSQAGTYVLVGRVTLKPKESVTRRVLLQDVWLVAADQITSLRRESDDILKKLSGTPYEDQARLLARSMEQRLSKVEEHQDQVFLSPTQHINQYREDVKTLEVVESDLVSLRQLMVMAAVTPAASAALLPADGHAGGMHDKGGLSILATWRIIFLILALLGLVSLSFFFVWQQQLKQQLAKQGRQDVPKPVTNGNGHGTPAAPAPGPITTRLQPPAPLAPR